MSELGLGVVAVDFTTVFGDSSEWDNEIQVPAKPCLGVVDVVNKGFNVQLTTLIEGHHDKLRAASTIPGVHRLIVFGDFT